MNKGLNQYEQDQKYLIDLLCITFQYAENYYYLYCKKNINADLNAKYGDLTYYLQQKFDDIKNKATKYLFDFKKNFEIFSIAYDIEQFNEYYESAYNWYLVTKTELFEILKTIFEDAGEYR